MDVITKFKGASGVMELYEDKIVYKRDLFMEHSEKVYLLKNISHIQFSRPNFLTNGFIRIMTASSSNIPNTSVMRLAEDVDTLFFRKKAMKEAEDFYQKANELMANL